MTEYHVIDGDKGNVYEVAQEINKILHKINKQNPSYIELNYKMAKMTGEGIFIGFNAPDILSVIVGSGAVSFSPNGKVINLSVTKETVRVSRNRPDEEFCYTVKIAIINKGK